MTKIAFTIPGFTSTCIPVADGKIQRSKGSVPSAVAEAEGYVLAKWPTVLGELLTEDEVDALLARNEAEATAKALARKQAEGPNPVVVRRLERAAKLLSYGVLTPAQIETAAASDEETDEMLAFLRGLPASQITDPATESETKETADMTTYRNAPNDERSKQRAIEIRMMGIENRANAGDPKAAETWKSIRYAKTVALATGKPLFAVMADMGIRL